MPKGGEAIVNSGGEEGGGGSCENILREMWRCLFYFVSLPYPYLQDCLGVTSFGNGHNAVLKARILRWL